MKLHDELILLERESVSDGAGGKTPGQLTKICDLWGAVKPLSGFIGLSFQQMTGVQGFEVMIRTDFTFAPEREYILIHKSIYGDKAMMIHSTEIGQYYTKLTCKSENKLPTGYS